MIIYARQSTSRKPEFQVSTTIEKVNGSLVVKKAPMTKSAEKHVHNMVKTYERLKNLKAPQVVPATLQEKSVVFPFQPGETLEDMFVSSLIDKKFNNVETVLNDAISLTKGLPQKIPTANEMAKFSRIFGKKSIKSNDPCIASGLLDLNLDNIIIHEGDTKLIDYEWTFGFPVPVRLVIGRMFYNIFAYKTVGLLHGLASNKFPVVEIATGVLVPEFIYRNPRFNNILRRKNLEPVLIAEHAFQRYVTGQVSKPPNLFDRPVVHKRQLFLRTTDRLAGLVAELEESKKENDILRSERSQLVNELDAIKGSRIYKIYKASKRARRRVRA